MRALVITALSFFMAACSAVVSPDPRRLSDVDAGPAVLDARLDSPDASAPCGAGTIVCGASCVDPSSDPTACGGCGRACGAGQSCVSGACACPAGDPACGPRELGDPSRCGPTGTRCRDDQLCISGSCQCRPPLEAVGGRCVDLASDPENCGTPGTRCGDGVCSMGACRGACADRTRDCDGACVDLRSDPLHCGECGRACGADEACQSGECRDASPATGCVTCPCPRCGGGACCILPRFDVPYCLDAERCP